MITNRLRRILADKDIKISELVRMTGIGKNTLYAIYHDTFKVISLNHVDKICEVLDITPSQLFEYSKG